MNSSSDQLSIMNSNDQLSIINSTSNPFSLFLNSSSSKFTNSTSDELSIFSNYVSDQLSIFPNSTFDQHPSISDECEYEPQPYLTEKFFLTTVCGTCVSAVAFFNNCLLLHVLIRSSLIKTHVFYLCVLAVCDILAEISYVLLLSMQILFDYAESVSLYRVWHQYVTWVYGLTHIALTVSAYMIVSASAERFLSTLKWFKYRSCSGRDRLFVTLGVVIFAILTKGIAFWELEVVYNENCHGFGEYNLIPSRIAREPIFRMVYALWFRHVVHVFLPFILLLLLNGAILLHLNNNPLELHSALISLTLGDLARQRKRSIRAATLMLAAIVTTYLISNSLNVVISIWEHIDYEYLLEQRKFYTFAADVISLLTVVTGCIRMPLYCACNKQLRNEIFVALTRWRNGGKFIRRSFKRLFFKAKENNEKNFINLLENGKGTIVETWDMKNGDKDKEGLISDWEEKF